MSSKMNELVRKVRKAKGDTENKMTQKPSVIHLLLQSSIRTESLKKFTLQKSVDFKKRVTSLYVFILILLVLTIYSLV